MSTTEWLIDTNGNRCCVGYFGSRKGAQKALDSLIDCKNCSNCSDCSYCSDCSGCSGCSGCSYCSDCSDCSYCSDCEYCSDKKEDTGELGPVIVPRIDRIHATVYAAASNPKSLDMSGWHKCENTHCRAGWVVTLAGEPGRALEERFNTELAAMLIYAASSPELHVSPARLYDTNDDALADMKRLADFESEGSI